MATNQYDLAIAKMEIAKSFVVAAFEGRRPGLEAEANLELLTKLFAAAYAAITEVVEPTVTHMLIPGPDDTARP